MSQTLLELELASAGIVKKRHGHDLMKHSLMGYGIISSVVQKF